MAVDMFLKITTIDGETVDSKFKSEKACDILAWSWGMAQSGTMHQGGGGGSGKVSVQDLSVTKYVDVGSHAIMLACCNGEHFEKATLTVRKAGKDALEYMVIEMEEVIITSVSTGGSGGEDRLTENIALNFAKFNFKYKQQTPKGAGEAFKECKWDIAENVAW